MLNKIQLEIRYVHNKYLASTQLQVIGKNSSVLAGFWEPLILHRI